MEIFGGVSEAAEGRQLVSGIGTGPAERHRSGSYGVKRFRYWRRKPPGQHAGQALPDSAAYDELGACFQQAGRAASSRSWLRYRAERHLR